VPTIGSSSCGLFGKQNNEPVPVIQITGSLCHASPTTVLAHSRPQWLVSTDFACSRVETGDRDSPVIPDFRTSRPGASREEGFGLSYAVPKASAA
jgi:hypothetical protein